MTYYLERDADGFPIVQTGTPFVGCKTYRTEAAAHRAAIAILEAERDRINQAIRDRRRMVKECEAAR